MPQVSYTLTDDTLTLHTDVTNTDGWFTTIAATDVLDWAGDHPKVTATFFRQGTGEAVADLVNGRRLILTGINFYAPDSGGDSTDAVVFAARVAVDRALLEAAR